MNNATVSVIIPTFNRAALIINAITSVLNQSYDNWELIIVDDNSNDNTKSLVEKYIKIDNRIRYIRNNRRTGPSGARNAGIMRAAGKYLAFLDSDDVWFPHHLSDCVNVLEKYNMEVCFALWREKKKNELVNIDDDPAFQKSLTKAIARLKPLVLDNLLFFNHNILEHIILHGFYCFHINTFVINKDIITDVGLFNEKMCCAEDMDFIFRVLYHFDFCLINDYHFIYNEGKDNIYKFSDRNNIEINEIVRNKELGRRLTKTGKDDIVMKKNLKKLILASDSIREKERCVNVLNMLIGRKYFTLGVINTNYHKLISIYFLILSLLFELKRKTITYLFKALFQNYNEKMNVQTTELDLL